ncbi:MAG: PIN domain-containing protein [Ardenticatenaceae bacterium]|nr:PIN domain-containing protein [Ardenticatenaceae bacterium]
MSEMIFLDSNIWLYAMLTYQSQAKSLACQNLIHANQDNITLSSQVVIEVIANLLRKGNFSEVQIVKFIEDVYRDHLVIDVSPKVMLKASQLRAKYSFSYFDSLIVAAALETGSTLLYSEDMHNGLVVENQLTITNPFALAS